MSDIFANRYKLERQLGVGGWGTVHLSRDTQLERDVAIKVLRQVESGDDGNQRFMREARVIARLNHPGIVTLYDAGQSDDATYLAFEYVPGPDLRAFVQSLGYTLNRPRALAIAKLILEALVYAHDRGVVHSDLKPENVLIIAEPQLATKLTDFGLATIVGQSRHSKPGDFSGTAAYMPPERILGEPFDKRGDLYAFGIMLYELVCHRLPFDADSPAAIMYQQVYQQPVPPSQLIPNIENELEALILKLLEKQPARRPGSAQEVLAVIRNVEQQLAVTGTTVTPRSGARAAELGPRLVNAPLVGRAIEIGGLKSAYERVSHGAGQVTLIAGEPGVGKSRLIEELSIYTRLRNSAVLHGHCSDVPGSPPFGPWLEMLRHHIRRTDDTTLAAQIKRAGSGITLLLPELIGSTTVMRDGDPEEQRMMLFDGVVGFLDAIASESGLVLSLDDVQWADRSSLQLLRYVGRVALRSPILLLCAYQDVESHPNSALEDTLSELSRSPHSTRLVLRRLDTQSTRELAESLLAVGSERSAHLDNDAARAIFKETEGNPFFIGEVVRHLVEEHGIRRGGDTWSLVAGADSTIPQGIRSVVGRRIWRLPERTRETLSHASILGRHFAFDVLARLMGGNDLQVTSDDEDRLVRDLEEARLAGLIAERVGPNGEQFAFVHDKIREVIYREISVVQRRRLHERAALVLQSLSSPRPSGRYAQLAYQFMAAGDNKQAVVYSKLAAEHARSLYVWDEAAAYYLQALDLLEERDTDEERSAILELLATVEFHSGQDEHIAERLEQALALRTSLGHASHVAALHGRLAWEYSMMGNSVEVEQHVRAALSLPSGLLDNSARARCLTARAILLDRVGKAPEDVLAAFHAARVAHRKAGNTTEGLWCEYRVIGTLIREGHNLVECYQRSADLRREVDILPEGPGVTQLRIFALNRHGAIALRRAQFAEAQATADQAIDLAQKFHMRIGSYPALENLARVAIAQGEWVVAEKALERLTAVGGYRPQGYRLEQLDTVLHAYFAAARELWEEALDLLHDSYLRDAGREPWGVEPLLLAASAHGQLGNSSQAKALLQRANHALHQYRLLDLSPLFERTAALQSERDGRRDNALGLLRRALDAAVARGARHAEALCHLEIGQILSHDGHDPQQQQGIKHLRSARDLFSEFGCVPLAVHIDGVLDQDSASSHS